MRDEPNEPDFARYSRDSFAALQKLKEALHELKRRKERSEEAYRQVFADFASALAIGSADWHEHCAAVQCRSSGRLDLAYSLLAVGFLEEAIDELHVALRELDAIQGIETYQLKSILHRTLGHFYGERSLSTIMAEQKRSALALAFRHFSQSLDDTPMMTSYSSLEQMVGILEADPATAAGSIGLCDVLINIRPKELEYRFLRAQRMVALGLHDLLTIEAVAAGEASFEEIARAVTACAALGRHEDARALTARGRKLAMASGDEDWRKVFSAYRQPMRPRHIY